MPAPINEQVVVIIGASSGLGRQTAYDLAEKGATVVVAARREAVLQELAHELLHRGAKDALAVATDVADNDQVQNLIRTTLERFSRLDTLIVSPGIAIFAPVEQTTLQEFERMFDVMLMGYVRAAKAVLPVFRRQGFGTLINVASALGMGAVPLQGAYTTTKHGVVGFTQTLQMELYGSGIDVCLFLPGSMATPLPSIHSRSKTGRVPKAVPPVFHPKLVSRVLVRCVEHPRPTIKPDPQSKLAITIGQIAPKAATAFLARFGERLQMTDEPEPSFGHDNVDEPMDEGAGVLGQLPPTSEKLIEWCRRHPLKLLAGGIAVGAATYVAGRGLARIGSRVADVANANTKGRITSMLSSKRRLRAV
ncbi:MAG TPA: SDR family NAD(P)-dependent oxidoreductase [Blastocatellia bacterium]|nr:SDR family NAD(P)-dependent oxidoreductase [Blastocatellia bacterium]